MSLFKDAQCQLVSQSLVACPINNCRTLEPTVVKLGSTEVGCNLLEHVPNDVEVIMAQFKVN